MEEKYYTCKYDRAFKEVFLKENNKDLLKTLIEKVLKIKIKEIKLRPNERNQDNIRIKRKTYDALVKTENKVIEIEVNANANEEYVNPRNMSYISDLYSHNTLKGEEYDDKTEIVQINFSYNLKDKEKIREYYVQDKSNKKYVENFRIIEINMDYFVNLWYTNKEEEINKYKILIMLGLEKEDLKKLSKEDKVVSKYMNELNKINEDPEFREYMTYEEDQRKIFNSRMSAATRKGLQKGIQKGITERNIEIAKKMLKENLSTEEILEITDLSIEELNKIKKEITK